MLDLPQTVSVILSLPSLSATSNFLIERTDYRKCKNLYLLDSSPLQLGYGQPHIMVVLLLCARYSQAISVTHL